ncbi:MAG TPA: hypothetical protein PK231_04620 [Acidocella sp.]|nr:hypothetical protein [Acidocella sp.]OYV51049.1 MAG: hypothetical protein B7Z77_04645 [Acidocella sp. 20-58-15]HQT38687.1 hypothetical protein [Acidocella sp.]
MIKSNMNLTSETKSRVLRPVKALAVLGLMAATLAGCVVYPSGGYERGYAYAPAPVYVAPPPVVFGFGYGGGWGHRDWR